MDPIDQVLQREARLTMGQVIQHYDPSIAQASLIQRAARGRNLANLDESRLHQRLDLNQGVFDTVVDVVR